jgi:hypothetical protein
MFIFGLIELAVAFMFFSSKEYGWAILQLFIAAFFSSWPYTQETTIIKTSKDFI